MNNAKCHTNAMLPAAATLALLLAGPLAAQPPMDGPVRWGASGTDQHVARMTEQFDLSADQQQAIARLFEERASQKDKERMEFRQKIDAVLTAEQRAKRDALRAAHIEQRVARMTGMLDLSEEQQAQFKTLMTASRGQGQSRRDGGMRAQLARILTPEQLAVLAEQGMGMGMGGKHGSCRR